MYSIIQLRGIIVVVYNTMQIMQNVHSGVGTWIKGPPLQILEQRSR